MVLSLNEILEAPLLNVLIHNHSRSFVFSQFSVKGKKSVCENTPPRLVRNYDRIRYFGIENRTVSSKIVRLCT